MAAISNVFGRVVSNRPFSFLSFSFFSCYLLQLLHTIRWRARWTANSTWWEGSVTLRPGCRVLPTRWPMTWRPPWRRRTSSSPDSGRRPWLSAARPPTRSTSITNAVVRPAQVGWQFYLFTYFWGWNLHLIRRFPLEGFDQSQIIIFNLIWHFFLSFAWTRWSGYLCRSTWNDDHDERIKYVIVTPLHAAANRHGVDGPPRRFCLTVTTHGSKASTLTPSDLQSQHPQDHVSSVSNNGAPLEWIASSETCVRTYARYDDDDVIFKSVARVFLNWLLIWFPLWNTIGTDWRLTGSIRRTWHTTPTICISRRRTGREIRPALPFSTSRRLASARVSRQPYSISGSYSPPPRHPRRPPRPPPPFCRHRRWITSGSCRWSWLRAASLVGDSFLPPYSCCSSFSLQVQQVKKNKEKGIKTWNGRKKKKND